MAKLDDYSTRYKTIKFTREDGILQITLHTEGKELQWGWTPHTELPLAFQDVANDTENRVVILTGTGKEFSGPKPVPGPRFKLPITDWERLFRERAVS